MFRFLTLSSIIVGFAFGSNKTCDDEESCADGEYAKTDIWCRGYKACYDSTLNCSDICSCGGLLACHDADILTGGDSICNGEYGCKYATITSDENIWCDGRYGCKFTTLNADTNIYCDGEYSCRLNTIESAYYIYARGFGSLQYSDISGFQRIYANGYLALTNAVINTTNITTVIATFGGDDTTMNAKFICTDDSTCYIYCTTSSGCNKLKVFCYGTCVVSCDDEWQSCPNTTDISSDTLTFNENVLFQELAEREEYRRNEFEREMEEDDIILRVAPTVEKNNYWLFGGINGESSLSVANNLQELKILIIGITTGLIIAAIVSAAYWVVSTKNSNSKYQRDMGYQTLA